MEELLEEFGEIDYCKFVMNHLTEKPKGKEVLAWPWNVGFNFILVCGTKQTLSVGWVLVQYNDQGPFQRYGGF